MSFFRRLIILLKPMWNIYKINTWVQISLGIPGGSAVKYPPASAGDEGSILGSERSPREGNGNPLQYSCLGNPMDRGAWRTIYSPWGHKRDRHDLATKWQQQLLLSSSPWPDPKSKWKSIVKSHPGYPIKAYIVIEGILTIFTAWSLDSISEVTKLSEINLGVLWTSQGWQPKG